MDGNLDALIAEVNIGRTGRPLDTCVGLYTLSEHSFISHLPK